MSDGFEYLQVIRKKHGEIWLKQHIEYETIRREYFLYHGIHHVIPRWTSNINLRKRALTQIHINPQTLKNITLERLNLLRMWVFPQTANIIELRQHISGSYRRSVVHVLGCASERVFSGSWDLVNRYATTAKEANRRRRDKDATLYRVIW